MKNYKVLEDFTHEDVEYTVDSVVELDEEIAAPLVAEGKLEEVVAGEEETV